MKKIKERERLGEFVCGPTGRLRVLQQVKLQTMCQLLHCCYLPDCAQGMKRWRYRISTKTLYSLVCCFKRYYETIFQALLWLAGFTMLILLTQLIHSLATFDKICSMLRCSTKGVGNRKKQAEPTTPGRDAMLWSNGSSNVEVLGCY